MTDPVPVGPSDKSAPSPKKQKKPKLVKLPWMPVKLLRKLPVSKLKLAKKKIK